MIKVNLKIILIVPRTNGDGVLGVYSILRGSFHCTTYH